MKTLILAIVLITISYSPNTFVNISLAQENKPVEKGLSIKLGKDLIVPNESIKIKFIDVLEDSRCPKGARCIWAGNAKVRIEVEQNSETKIIELNSTVNPKEISHAGYKISFLGLTPYPDTSKQTNKSDYTVNLEVLKASKE